jgi:hypothetical protein
MLFPMVLSDQDRANSIAARKLSAKPKKQLFVGCPRNWKHATSRSVGEDDTFTFPLIAKYLIGLASVRWHINISLSGRSGFPFHLRNSQFWMRNQ